MTQDRVRTWANKAGINYYVYRIWTSMRERCNNPDCHAYSRYGGRGIRVCKRWDSFAFFAIDVGKRPAGLTLERRNNNRGYSPANCYWATRKTQQRNTCTVKLSVAKVQAIRRLYVPGEITQREIGIIYGVHQVTVSEAIRGVKWA